MAASPAAAKYPDRPITLIIPWAAGGGTDATGRAIAAVLQEQLGQPVNVVNRTGGQGVVGHAAIAAAKPDGYTLGIITVEINMLHWQGLTELSGDSYQAIGLYNQDPAGVQVRADSPYKTAPDLIKAAKAAPGKLKGSGTGQGGIWHLALAGMLNAAGLDAKTIPWVPLEGAAPSLQEMVAGGLDVVTCSRVEAQSMIDAGKVKAIALMAEKRSPIYPDLPTLKEQGIDWSLTTWRGFAGPKGMPKEVLDVLVPAFKKMTENPKFTEVLDKRGFGRVYMDPKDFAAFMQKTDASLGKVMKSAGLIK
jgi:tripartite-type tricarboxylate transporter receptor subunit TctC